MEQTNKPPRLTSKSPFDFARMEDVVYGFSRYLRRRVEDRLTFHMCEYVEGKFLLISKLCTDI